MFLLKIFTNLTSKGKKRVDALEVYRSADTSYLLAFYFHKNKITGRCSCSVDWIAAVMLKVSQYYQISRANKS